MWWPYICNSLLFLNWQLPSEKMHALWLILTGFTSLYSSGMHGSSQWTVCATVKQESQGTLPHHYWIPAIKKSGYSEEGLPSIRWVHLINWSLSLDKPNILLYCLICIGSGKLSENWNIKSSLIKWQQRKGLDCTQSDKYYRYSWLHCLVTLLHICVCGLKTIGENC